ncbi:hypothetical protein Fmac_008225 [Flemingia macrophylla]|uniref:Uncharacterized protein n=1 Tax=Flemingia macrophylla TaxID=520843 RepID=A0ABD1MWT3_9FABA
MASIHLRSFPVSYSVPATVGSYGRTKTFTKGRYATEASWYKTQKIHNEYPIVKCKQKQNLKHHYRGIEGRSSCQERCRSFVVNAAPGESFESESQISSPKIFWNSTKDSLNTFYNFSRPYATMTTVINITSACLLAVENLSDISPTFFIGLLKAIAVVLPMHMFNVALNHLTDYNIDKINKPYLPMASGEYSFGTVAIIVASSWILSYALGWIVGSPPLIWIISSHFIFGTVYSTNLPLLRWKRSSVLTAINYVVDRAIILHLGLFLHMQTSVFKRPTTYPRSLVFTIAFMSVLAIVIAFSKDIPDIEGDEKFGIRTLAVRLGQKQVLWICVSLLELAYGAAILFVAATSSCLWSKLITGLGHALLASVLWYRAKSLDVTNKAEAQSFYTFIWKLLCAECFMVPLVR